jgi:hypothetical protein
VERRRRCDLAVRAALVGFPVVRATFWCRLCTRPSPPSSIPCAAPPPAAARRCRSPLLLRRRLPALACDPSRRIEIRWARSNPAAP